MPRRPRVLLLAAANATSGGGEKHVADLLELLPASGVDEPDRAFALRAVREAGVASIPVSALYEEDPVVTILRLCFAKGDAVLDEAVVRLARARELSRAAR